MKKILSISAIVFLLAVIGLTSCEKTELQQEPQNNQATVDNTIDKILNFKNEVETPAGDKAETYMSIDSAVWYVEALLNYEYCVIKDSTEIYSDASLDSIAFPVTITNNKVGLNDAIYAFHKIEKSMNAGLNNISADNKRVNIVDVDYRDGQFVTYVEYNYEQSNKSVTSGNLIEYIHGDWRFGMDENNAHQGMCNGNYLFERDAATEINKAIRKYILSKQAYYTTFTDIDYFYYKQRDNGNDDYLFVRYDNPYRIWRESGVHNPPYNHTDFWFGYADTDLAPWIPCIQEEELNWYKMATIHAINQVKKYKTPQGKSFASYFLRGKKIINNETKQTYYFHQLLVTFGVGHCVNNTPIR